MNPPKTKGIVTFYSQDNTIFIPIFRKVNKRKEDQGNLVFFYTKNSEERRKNQHEIRDKAAVF